MTVRILITIFFFSTLLYGCLTPMNEVEKAINSINEKDMQEYISILASDELQGRKPCAQGEVKTIEYIKDLYVEFGLEPANNGLYYQEVPLVDVKVQPESNLIITKGDKKLELKYVDEFVAFSKQLVNEIEINNSEIVFAGYGIVAPEYNWNDYENLDVKDKIVVVMVNDPGFGTENKEVFNGNAMTYYGRWTYKYEEAARQGAKGLFIIHETKPAGYPWSVVINGATIPKLYLQPDDNYLSRCPIEGWLTKDAALKLFSFCDFDLSKLLEEAKRPGFKAVNMGVSINFKMKSEHSFATSYNVLGMIKGENRPDEVIVYTAHWDHLGIGNIVDGDSIYNGAVDNGTTMAWMFEIAEAFTKLPVKPDRSILFIATSAEEQGLLGAKYYVENPVFSLSKTVANINNDLMLPYGRYKDVMITGYGQSELEDYVAKYAKDQDRYILPDPNAHTGMYYRADHFPFAKVGIPALYGRGNCDSREHGKEWAAEMERDYLQNKYHKPADEYYEETWDLSGIVEDAALMFMVGYKLSNEEIFPQWKEGSEFKKIRDKMMKNE